MTTIGTILDGLQPGERAAIMEAFKSGSEYYVVYSPGLFIGVHTDANPALVTTLEAGVFRAGTIAHEAPRPQAG